MHSLERPYTPVADVVAVADKVANAEVDEETDASSKYPHIAKWTIIQSNHTERQLKLKIIHTPAGTSNEYATTAVFHKTSTPAASTSNMPVINAI
jgi:hypothetical protein